LAQPDAKLDPSWTHQMQLRSELSSSPSDDSCTDPVADDTSDMGKDGRYSGDNNNIHFIVSPASGPSSSSVPAHREFAELII